MSNKATIVTGVLEAKQQSNIIKADIPNAFVQTDIDQSGEKIIIKMRGELEDILVEVSPEIYSHYVVDENSHNVLYLIL